MKLGVTEHTLRLLKVIVDVHDLEPSDTEPTHEYITTYNHLIDMDKVMLENEIGDQF